MDNLRFHMHVSQIPAKSRDRIDPVEISRWSCALRKIFNRAAPHGKQLIYLDVSSTFREATSSASRPSQRPRGKRGDNRIYDFSPCSLMVASAGRICCVMWDAESHICVSCLFAAIVTLYRECRTFSRCGATLPVSIDNCGMCRAREWATLLGKLTSYILETEHRAVWSCVHDEIFCVDKCIFSETTRRDVRLAHNHGEWNVSVFRYSEWCSRCSVKLEFPQLKGPDRFPLPWIPLQPAWAKCASCHSADINGQFCSVCAFHRSAAGGFNVYTRSM